MTTRIAMTGCTLATLLAVAPASAETFYNQDGVVFEGTIRRVVSNAAICNVLEEKYTPDEYERLKANQGQPLHLWQVDFTIRNESGRALDYLLASSWVRSEYPPCTNWSGEGPGGGSVLPDPSLPIPPVWSDYYEVVQMPYGMRAGQEKRSALYVEVFEGLRPSFGEWDIKYTFAKEAGAAANAERSGGSSGRPGGAGARSGAAGQLPPEIQVDLNLRKAEQAVRDGDAATAREAMERLEALEAEHGLEASPEDFYRYAEAWAAAGEPDRAVAAAVRYLQIEGREGEHYTEALDLMNRAEFGQAGPAAGPAEGETPVRLPVPNCAGQVKGTSCWMGLSNQPGCYLWNPNLQENETVFWSGGCVSGLASGSGTIKWVSEGGGSEDTGLLRNGKPDGHWVLRFANRTVSKGSFVDGKANGLFVIHAADGTVAEGPMVEDKRHGRWVVRSTDGSTQTITYVNGVEQTSAEGSVGTTGSAAGGGSCEIPGYPSPPGGVANVGLAWCPSSIDLQLRAFALQAAGAQCAIATGSSSTPEQIQARRREIAAACGRLATLAARDGIPCRCPAGYGP